MSFHRCWSYTRMKAKILLASVSLMLTAASIAQTCREVVRDASGRTVQTTARQKQAGGSERAVIRNASGRIIGSLAEGLECEGCLAKTGNRRSG
jgi:hypothetical protein